jgi:hypothetical protein
MTERGRCCKTRSSLSLETGLGLTIRDVEETEMEAKVERECSAAAAMLGLPGSSC